MQKQLKLRELLFQHDQNIKEISECIQKMIVSKKFEDLYLQVREAIKMLEIGVNNGSVQQKNFFSKFQRMIKIANNNSQELGINLALYWIHIYSKRLLQIHKNKQSIELFKIVLNYTNNKYADRLLITTTLNNLCVLYDREKQPKLALQCILINVQICIDQMRIIISNKSNSDSQSGLKQNIQILKQNIQIYAVILVNSFKLGIKIIKNFLQKEKLSLYQIKEYIELSQLFNKMGYKTCRRFLGKKSIFIKYFEYVSDQKTVSKVNSMDQSTDLKNLQQILLQKLQKIQVLLKQNRNKQQPLLNNEPKQLKKQIISNLQSHAIEQNIEQNPVQNIIQSFEPSYPQQQTPDIIKSPQIQPQYPQQQIIQLQQQKCQPQQEQFKIDGLASGLLGLFVKGHKVDEQIIQLNGWNVQMQLNKIKHQRIGKLEIRCKHMSKNINFIQKLSDQKLEKLLHFFHLEDTLPYQHSIYDQPFNFISCCVKPYFNITEQGNIEFKPKSKGLFDQLSLIQFFSSKCLLSFHHVRGNNFRLALSPIQQSGSLYLNIQLSQETIGQIFQQIVDQTPQKIYKLYLQSMIKKGRALKIVKRRQKLIKLSSQDKLKQLVLKIANGFDQFLKNEQDQLQQYDILYLIQKDEWLFKFKQTHENKGTFYRVKYFKQTKQFSVYAQQISLSRNKNNAIQQSQLKLKGNAIFSNKQFVQLFGFSFQYELLKDKIKRIQQIICLKYHLKKNTKFKSTVNVQSYDQQYCDNFMLQQIFNAHCFKIKFITNQQLPQYYNPLTATIITLSNRLPLGIRISYYDVDKIQTKGYFIHIYAEDWNYDNYLEPISFQNSIDQSYQINENSITQTKSKQIKLNATQSVCLFKNYQQKYSYEMQYFIGVWMRKEGFQKILTKVMDKQSPLYLQSNMNKIVNWMRIFQD